MSYLNYLPSILIIFISLLALIILVLQKKFDFIAKATFLKCFFYA